MDFYDRPHHQDFHELQIFSNIEIKLKISKRSKYFRLKLEKKVAYSKHHRAKQKINEIVFFIESYLKSFK